jgi:hypothetical protein
MGTRPIGNPELPIACMGFGAWVIGGSGEEYARGAQEGRESIEAIHKALDLGVNWIDTTAAYGFGTPGRPSPRAGESPLERRCNAEEVPEEVPGASSEEVPGASSAVPRAAVLGRRVLGRRGGAAVRGGGRRCQALRPVRLYPRSAPAPREARGREREDARQ